MKKSKYYRDLLKKMAEEWKWLFTYIKRYRYIMLLYIVIGVSASFMALGISLASKYLVDAVVQHQSDNLVTYVIIVISLAIFQHLFQAASSWISAVVSSKSSNEVRQEIYSHIILAGWEDISRFHSGDLLNRLESDVSTISSGAISFIPTLFTRTFQFLGALAIVLYFDKTMALLALMSAPFLFISSRFLVSTIRKYNKKTREINGEVLSFTEESVQNIQIIKAFDLTKDYIDKFTQILKDYRKVKLSFDKFSILMTLVLSLIGVAVSYTCYGWGVYRLWQGAISFGTMTMFLQLSGSLTSAFGALASMAPTAVSIATSAGRVMEVTGFEKENDNDREKAIRILRESQDTGVSVEMNDVSFAYKGAENPVLRNISLAVSPGQTVAFIGPSGEGKTTLLKLILGLVKPTQGEMSLVSPSGEKLTLSDSTRRFCSYVPQTVNMFSGTIRENLLTVKSNATDTELLEVMKTVDLFDLIQELPLGLDTPINENGNNFSQGQLQRMAIARALLRNSLIILMDEATSALDIETENRVLNNIMVYNPNKICIITTHRESMLKYCDRIIKINSKGEMAEIKKDLVK